jgi:tartrate dehydrogenase/decarboxylase / D-malate dehydrogenase
MEVIMKKYNIAVIPGDGIGKEVMEEGIKVLKKLAERNESIRFNFDTFDWGCEYYLKHGEMMDDNGLEKLKK